MPGSVFQSDPCGFGPRLGHNGRVRRRGRLSRVSVSVDATAIGNHTPNERDFMRHLDTVHHIPAAVLASSTRLALVELHESEHTPHPSTPVRALDYGPSS